MLQRGDSDEGSTRSSERSIQILPYVDGPIPHRSLHEKLALAPVFGSRCGRVVLQTTVLIFFLLLALAISLAQPEVLDQLDHTIWQDPFFQGTFNNQVAANPDEYFVSCEAIQSDSFVAQPVNAVSCIVYAFAGLIMIGFAIADSCSDGQKNIEDSLLLRRPVWSLMLGIATTFLCLTGFLFHASFTNFAHNLDLMAWWFLAATFILFTLFRLITSLFVVESDVVTFDKQQQAMESMQEMGGLDFAEDDDSRSIISDIRRVSARSSRRILQEGTGRSVADAFRELDDHEREIDEAERQIQNNMQGVERQAIRTNVRYDPGCVWDCCGVRASCRVGGLCAGCVADLVALGSVGAAGLGIFLFGSFVDYELRQESVFVLFTLMFLTLTSAHWCFHRRIVAYSWSVMGLGVFLFAFGFVLNFYESAPLICVPKSLFQAHALWHALSGFSILCVYLFFRGDALSPPDPYKEGADSESGRFLVVRRAPSDGTSMLDPDGSGIFPVDGTSSIRSGESGRLSKGGGRRVTSLRRMKQRQQATGDYGGNSTLSSSSVGHDRVRRRQEERQRNQPNDDEPSVTNSNDISITVHNSNAPTSSNQHQMDIQQQQESSQQVNNVPSSSRDIAPAIAVAIPASDNDDVHSIAESSVTSDIRPPSLPVIMEYHNDSGGHLLSLVRGNQDVTVVDGTTQVHQRSQSLSSGSRLGDRASQLLRNTRPRHGSDTDSDSDDSVSGSTRRRQPPPATANRERYESKYSDVSAIRQQSLAAKSATRLGDCTLCSMPVHEREIAKDANEQMFHGGCLKCFTCFLDLTDSEHVIDKAADGTPEIYCLEHGRDRDNRHQNNLVRGSSASSLSHRDSSRLSMSVRARREEIQERLRLSVAEAPTCSKCGGELLDGNDIIVAGMERYHKVCPSSQTLYRVPRYFARRAPAIIAISFSCSSKSKKTYTFLFALDTLTKERALKENRVDPVKLGYEPDTGARAKVKRKITVPPASEEAFKFSEQSGMFRSLGGKQSAPALNPTTHNVVGTLFHMEGGVRQTLTVWIRYSRETKTAEAVSATLDIRLTPQKVGRTVSAKVLGWRQYYKGTIHAANEDGSYDILFDDGEYVQGVREHQIRAELRG